MLKAASQASLMLQEIRSAEEWIAGFFQDWDNRIARYHGPGWRPAGTTGESEPDPENFSYEWAANYFPKLVLGNPRVRISTTRTGVERLFVKAHELALNRWIRETKMKVLNEKLAIDWGHHRAICLILPAQDSLYSDLDDPKNWPSAKRVSPKRYVYDVQAIEKEEELWRGYKTRHQRHELLERADDEPKEGWITSAIKALGQEAGMDEMRPSGRGRDGAPERDEVVLYNVWVRDYEPTKADRAFFGEEAWDRKDRVGAWLTLGVAGDDVSDWVRRPFPYWGHRRGPFVIIDGYMIPDEPVGLAQIPAVEYQTRELNKHARGLSRAMASYKRGVLVDGSDPEFSEKIESFKDQFVVGLDGLTDVKSKVMQIELGGATELHITHNELLRDRVNRASGITDVRGKGLTDPRVTATADSIADEGMRDRTGFPQGKFIDGINEILENASYYMAHDNTRTELGPEALRVLRDPESGKPIEQAVYYGGGMDDDAAAWFDSLSMTIEAYSMGQTSEQLEQQRVLQLMNTVAVLIPMMAQYPFVLWDDLIETLGEMMNMENLGDYFDPEALAQFQSLMLQGQEITAQSGGGKAQPRLNRDVSRMLGGRQQVPKAGNLLGSLLSSAQTARQGAQPVFQGAGA
jgi:hypothetical protein